MNVPVPFSSSLLASASGHVDMFSFVMIELAIIVVLAVIGRWIAGRLGQPPVLGELTMGVIAGNIGYWLAIPGFVVIMNLGDTSQVFAQALETNQAVSQVAGELAAAGSIEPALAELLSGEKARQMFVIGTGAWTFSNFGVLLLMFMVGLGSSVSEMKSVGGRATAVALIGVFASLGAGYLGARLALPDAGYAAHLFLGVILCATSVGISARVFQSLDRDKTTEAKIVFGASVIDDVASIIVLAVVIGIATTGSVDLLSVAKILGLALGFLGGVILLGETLVEKLVKQVERFDRTQAKLLFPLVLLFVFAWIANLMQLATITGAFGAGLIVRDSFFDADSKGKIEDLVHPLEALFAPVFFVLMGMQVNLQSLADPAVLLITGVMTVAAVVGKFAAALAAGPNDKLTVGLGMVPRGEEALLFASMGITLGVLDSGLFSAVVLMVMLTALVAPIGLKWSLLRGSKPPAPA